MGGHSIGPGGLFWTRRRAGVGFRRVVPDTQDYFSRRPKAGRLHPSSKSSSDMIISCGDLRLVGSTRHRKVIQNPPRSGGSVGWCSKGCTRILTIYGVACGLVGGPAGWCSKKLHQNSYPGRLVFSLLCRWGGVPKVGVVFQKVVPESPLCILLCKI